MMIDDLYDVPRSVSVPLRTMGVLLLLVLIAVPSDAQTLRGRVLDGITRLPVSEARVALLHPDGTILEEVVSSENGSFSLAAPGVGDYYVKVERQGYATLFDGIIEFEAADGLLEVSLFLNAAPIEIEGLEVSVDRAQTRRRLRAQGYYQRAAMGFGRFIGPEEIDRIKPFMFGDVLRGIPGMIITGDDIRFRSSRPGGDGTCYANIYVDGVFMHGGFQVAAFLRPEDVDAVEHYRGPAQTPLMYSGVNAPIFRSDEEEAEADLTVDINGQCGTLVIWTKS